MDESQIQELRRARLADAVRKLCGGNVAAFGRLLGYGGGTFEVAYPLFHQLPVSPDLVWDRAHSTYLSLWAEMGVIAGSIPLLLVLWIAMEALRLYLSRRSGDWTAPAAAVAVIVVAALHSTVDFSLEMQANVFLFLAILATGIARRDAGEAEPA